MPESGTFGSARGVSGNGHPYRNPGSWAAVRVTSVHRPLSVRELPSRCTAANGRDGRVEDGRGGLGHAATPRFPSPLIEPDVPISGIRLSDWLHRGTHGE